MKKKLYSLLIVILMLMTVISIITLKIQTSIETSKISDENEFYENNSEETGLMFEDYGQGINIPLSTK